MSTATETTLGTHSEVGKLHTVMVHRPDLAHERLSPTNAEELLFDDVIWVRRARQEHDAFVDLMRSRGVEVLLLHELLAETLEDKEAREWLLSRRIRPEEVTVMFAEPLTEWLTEMPAEELATKLTGGVTVQELPDEIRSAIGPALGHTDFVLPPLPNQLFTRDTSAWLYGGVSLNPMFWPARQLETLNVEAIYRFHPRFRAPTSRSGSAAPTTTGGMRAWRAATSCPPADGVVLVGMGERSTARAVSILAQNMFAADAARLVIGAQMPQASGQPCTSTRSSRFCDRDVVTLYEPVVSQIRPILFRPGGPVGVQAEVSERAFLDEVKDALGHHRPEGRHDRRRRVRGGAQPVGRRQQRRRSRTRRRRRLRAQRGDEREAREGRGRGARDRRPGARPRTRGRPLHDLSNRPRGMRKGARP